MRFVRARSDQLARSTYAGTGLPGMPQGPRRFDFWSDAKRAISKGAKDAGRAVAKGAKDVSRVLPSAGQFIGGAALGPFGQVIGGRIDPRTSELQRKIGDTVAGAAAGIGGAALAGAPIPTASTGAIPAVAKAAAGAVGDAAGGAGLGGIGLGDVLDFGLGTAGLVNAAQLSGKSDTFANQAYSDVRDSYDARAPLRSAGVAGMMNPSAGVPLKMANVDANTGRGNPFATKPGARSAGVPFTPTPTTPPGPMIPPGAPFPGFTGGVPQGMKYSHLFPGPAPDVYNGVPQGMGLSETWNKNIPRAR